MSTLVRTDPDLMRDVNENSFGVLYGGVGSPYIPAQDFVVAHGVKSAFGFGGLLPGGDLDIVVLFSKVPITRATAELFKTLGLIMKLAIGALADKVFGPGFPRDESPPCKEPNMLVQRR